MNSRNLLSELLNGKHGISAEMAYRLDKAFGSTPESWLNLQTIYDLAQVREKAEALDVRPFTATGLSIWAAVCNRTGPTNRLRQWDMEGNATRWLY